MDETRSEWQPEIGEYCRVDHLNDWIRFGKIIGRSAENPESVFIVKCIKENDSCAPNFLTQSVELLDKNKLSPIGASEIKLFGIVPTTIKQGIQHFYRKRALELSKYRLERALEEIEIQI